MAIMEKLSPQRLQQAAGKPLPQQDERPAGEPARHSNLPLEVSTQGHSHYSQGMSSLLARPSAVGRMNS